MQKKTLPHVECVLLEGELQLSVLGFLTYTNLVILRLHLKRCLVSPPTYSPTLLLSEVLEWFWRYLFQNYNQMKQNQKPLGLDRDCGQVLSYKQDFWSNA